MYEIAKSLLNEYVEIYTYLTLDKLYGELMRKIRRKIRN